jgi:hypothetical protein
MNWYKTDSTEIPKAVDCTSSPTTVWVTRNCVTKEKQDEETGETKTIYEYEECKITKDEYIDMLHEQQEITNEALQELILMMEV